MKRRLEPPCARDCPRRSAVPNCHNPELCEDWARYLAEKAAVDKARERAQSVERDLTGMQVRRSVKAAKEAKRH